MSWFRIVDPDGELLGDADTLDQVTEIVRSARPGRYHIDEMSSTPLSSGHTARRWGVVVHNADGRIEKDPDPWPA
jgi:hypothetical protein